MALIGDGIENSLSPKIHYALAKRYNIKLQYDLIDTKDFKKNLDFIKKNYHKINITSPFKEMASECCDILEEPAIEINSVNSIIFKEKIIGTSTDGLGLIEDLTEKKITIENSNILILGAGGASRSIVKQLLKRKPKLISILNRTKSKVIESNIITKKIIENYDILIQTTNYQNIGNSIKDLNLERTICYDINYGVKSNNFIIFLKEKKAKKIFDGKGMLYKQAEISFINWLNT